MTSDDVQLGHQYYGRRFSDLGAVAIAKEPSTRRVLFEDLHSHCRLWLKPIDVKVLKLGGWFPDNLRKFEREMRRKRIEEDDRRQMRLFV